MNLQDHKLQTNFLEQHGPGLLAVHQQCLGHGHQLKDQMHVILEDRIRVFINSTNLPVVLVDQQKRGCPPFCPGLLIAQH